MRERWEEGGWRGGGAGGGGHGEGQEGWGTGKGRGVVRVGRCGGRKEMSLSLSLSLELPLPCLLAEDHLRHPRRWAWVGYDGTIANTLILIDVLFDISFDLIIHAE